MCSFSFAEKLVMVQMERQLASIADFYFAYYFKEPSYLFHQGRWVLYHTALIFAAPVKNDWKFL